MAVNSNPENDEKIIYARKSRPKENTKKSTKAKKSVIGEKGTTSGKKSIDELMSEVVRSNGKFFCPEKCGKWYSTKMPIKKHLLSHRPKSEWPWVCLFCGRHFQVGKRTYVSFFPFLFLVFGHFWGGSYKNVT